MDINRHNYESFFLLLVDGELNAREQEEVMLFVNVNPDLAVELEALYATKLPTNDLLVFPNKQSLYKQTGVSISLENYEAWFCAYVDKELTKEEVAAVELFVLQHPSLQETFMLVQQTVLPAEEIIFVNKEQLYRTTAKRVVFMPYLRRLAVAAAFIAFLFSIWFVTRSTTNNVDGDLAGATVTGNGNTVTTPPITKAIEKNNDVAVTENNVVRSTNTLTGNKVVSDSKKEATELTTQIIAQVPPASKTNIEETIPTETTTTVGNVGAIGKMNEAVTAKAETESQEEELQRTSEKVIYKEIDTDDNSKSLYVGAIEINKDKLRGFFRKAGSIFKSKSKQEEDKTDTSPQRLK